MESAIVPSQSNRYALKSPGGILSFILSRYPLPHSNPAKKPARPHPMDGPMDGQWTVGSDADKISDMFLEERTVVAVSAEEAERFAKQGYGVRGVATALPGEYDSNFHLRASDGRALVLKCMHPAREASFIAMQCAALEHLRERAAHLPLPRVQSTKQGLLFTEFTDSAGQKRLVWMLTFLPGVTLEKANPHSSDLLRDLGRFLGELDRSLATFSHPAIYRELKWDLSRAGWIRTALHHIEEPSRRALAEYFL